jgi:uncharacterized protein YabE (DUF348 family)
MVAGTLATAVKPIVPVTVVPPATDVEDNEMAESAAALVDEGEDGELPHPT